MTTIQDQGYTPSITPTLPVNRKLQWGDQEPDFPDEEKLTPRFVSLRQRQLNLDRSVIPEEFRSELRIKCVDRDSDVSLISYLYCNDTDDELIKGCRGLIYENDRLILKTFGYIPEHTIIDIAEGTGTVCVDIDNTTFYNSYEGTLVRVYYHRDKWRVCTHKRLDAMYSKWSSTTSFGKMFTNCVIKHTGCDPDKWEGFFDTLDKDIIYCFLLLPINENRIVSTCEDTDQMLHVGSFSVKEDFKCIDKDIGVRKPEKVTLDSLENLTRYVDSIDINKYQGVIAMNTQDNTMIKIINAKYLYLSSLRGNEPSVKFRYLSVRKDMETRLAYLQLYPSFKGWFDLYETVLYEISNDILNAFITRFIMGDYINIPPREYRIMLECKHYITHSHLRLTLEDVQRFVDKQSPTDLNRMIKDRYFNPAKWEYYKTPGRNFYYSMRNHIVPRR